MADTTCSAPACQLEGRLYPSGRWCDSFHAPYLFAGSRPQGAEAYCAPRRCYCGGCPSWRPPNVKLPQEARTRLPELELAPPPDAITVAESDAMAQARKDLAAMVEQDLEPARARALRERNRRTAR